MMMRELKELGTEGNSGQQYLEKYGLTEHERFYIEFD